MPICILDSLSHKLIGPLFFRFSTMMNDLIFTCLSDLFFTVIYVVGGDALSKWSVFRFLTLVYEEHSVGRREFTLRVSLVLHED